MSAINRIIVGPDNTLTAIGNDEDDIPASIVAPVAGDADVEVGLEFSLISSLPVIWITTESHANADVFFNDEWVLKVVDGALVPITDGDRNGNRPVAVKPEESADETARKIIATWTAGLITLAEMVAELQKVDPNAPDDVDGERGHCDTCGAPCDDDGCTRDRDHAIAIDPFSTRS